MTRRRSPPSRRRFTWRLIRQFFPGHARLEDRRNAAEKQPNRQDKSDKKKKDKHHRDDPRKTAVWITDWKSPDDSARWSVRPPAEGKYEIDLTYGCGKEWGGDFIVNIAGHDLPAHTQSTRNPEDFKVVTLMTLPLTASPTMLTIRPANPIRQGSLMNLKEVKLIPAN